jgi:hypothetical protein
MASGDGAHPVRDDPGDRRLSKRAIEVLGLESSVPTRRPSS